MRKYSLSFISTSVLLSFTASVVIASGSHGATTKPTPKPTVKISTKVVPKKSAPSQSAKSTVKPTVKSSTKATARAATSKKPVAKPTTKATKKPVKKVARKKVRVTPSPKPKWPPTGFYTDKSTDSDVYARIPSSKELIGVISAKASLSQRIGDCEKFACGAVQVASFIGCSWWEVTSTLYETQPDKSRKVIGNLRTLVGKSAPQQILTILLVSQESVAPGQIIDNISISCHRDTPTENFPQYFYTPIANASEAPSKS